DPSGLVRGHLRGLGRLPRRPGCRAVCLRHEGGAKHWHVCPDHLPIGRGDLIPRTHGDGVPHKADAKSAAPEFLEKGRDGHSNNSSLGSGAAASESEFAGSTAAAVESRRSVPKSSGDKCVAPLAPFTPLGAGFSLSVPLVWHPSPSAAGSVGSSVLKGAEGATFS